jgi:hypothetical protein
MTEGLTYHGGCHDCPSPKAGTFTGSRASRVAGEGRVRGRMEYVSAAASSREAKLGGMIGAADVILWGGWEMTRGGQANGGG